MHLIINVNSLDNVSNSLRLNKKTRIFKSSDEKVGIDSIKDFRQIDENSRSRLPVAATK